MPWFLCTAKTNGLSSILQKGGEAERSDLLKITWHRCQNGICTLARLPLPTGFLILPHAG